MKAHCQPHAELFVLIDWSASLPDRLLCWLHTSASAVPGRQPWLCLRIFRFWLLRLLSGGVELIIIVAGESAPVGLGLCSELGFGGPVFGQVLVR